MLTIFVAPVEDVRTCVVMAVFAWAVHWAARSFVSMGLQAVCRALQPPHLLQVAVHWPLDVKEVVHRQGWVVAMADEGTQLMAVVVSR